MTYNDNGRVSAQRADDDPADDGHRVAGSAKRVRQEEHTGADRALHQVHERGEISAKHICLFAGISDSVKTQSNQTTVSR